MRLFYYLMLFLSFLVHVDAAPATDDAALGISTTSAVTGIYFETATRTMPDMQAGITPADYNMDLFLWTSRNKLTEFLLQTTPVLSDGLGNTIPLVYSYTSIASGTTISILNNTWITLVPNGDPSHRDGVTSPGFITISTGPIPANQIAGTYTTGAIPVDVIMNGLTSTAPGFITLNTTVTEFIVIGFADTSADSGGIKFVGEDILFGSLTPGVAITPITKDVFVHTNRDADIQITFADTPPLLSAVDGTTTLPVTYSYSLNSVSANVTAGVPFVAFSGANDGTTSVGSITFAPDTPTMLQTSGGYSATVNVVVSAM